MSILSRTEGSPGILRGYAQGANVLRIDIDRPTKYACILGLTIQIFVGVCIPLLDHLGVDIDVFVNHKLGHLGSQALDPATFI